MEQERGAGERRSRARGDSDASLAHAVARGDTAALAQLYDRHAPALLALGMRMVGDRDEAEDLVHDVFVEAWQAAGQYDQERGSVRAWLCRRLRSRAIDRLRSPGRARAVSIDAMNPSERTNVEPDPSLLIDGRALRDALVELPDEQRQVVELAYYQGLSCSELADKLSLPLGTVKSRAAAALSKLRDALGGRGAR